MPAEPVTILSVIGTRPEAIKMAPVLRELRRLNGRTRSVVCITGQHRELMDQALSLCDIRPDHDLDLMQPDQGLAQLTSRMLDALDSVVREVRPDWILAQGDTTSVLVSALCAFYNHVPFAHVEAGLRSGDRRHPFPEEANRRLADATADLCFAPTERARQALLSEGVAGERVLVTGNTVVDALHEVMARPWEWAGSGLEELARSERLVLVTAHRRESFGAPLRELCLAIRDLSRRFRPQGVRFVLPVHLNPNVRQAVAELLTGEENIALVEPLDYQTMAQLMRRAYLILTDSGGIQEEGPSLGVPVLVMRETTERPEGIEAGVAKLVGTARERIVAETALLLDDPAARQAMSRVVSPYGDGHAAERIVAALTGRRAR